MPNNHNKTSVYSLLIESIGTLYTVNESIELSKKTLSPFLNYIKENELEISKFKKCSEELCVFLDGYDFSQSPEIQKMYIKIKALHPLRLKLMQLGEEVKKISVFPNRYGSREAIEKSRSLVVNCMERMRLDETDKISQLLDSNIEKILVLQELFSGDEYILDQIKNVIKTDQGILKKFKTYYAGLMQYVEEFPHVGEDNLSVVVKYIETIKKVDGLIDRVNVTITSIKPYCDRYNKDKVVNDFMITIKAAHDKMRLTDVDVYHSRLVECEKQARTVIDNFDNEIIELQDIQYVLDKFNYEIWAEEREAFRKKTSSLLNNGHTRMISFDIEDLKNQISKAKCRRSSHIDEMVARYPWLTSKKYQHRHNQLVSSYIKSSEYDEKIEDMRLERKSRMIVKIIGWIVVIFVAYLCVTNFIISK